MIAPRLPRAVQRLGSRLAVRSASAADAPLAEARALLRARQRRETEELGAVLGRTFPEWQTLHGRR
jgi:hypothetical protein